MLTEFQKRDLEEKDQTCVFKTGGMKYSPENYHFDPIVMKVEFR